LPRKGFALSIPTTVLRIELFALRHETKLTHLYLDMLRRRNERSQASVITLDGPIVSMTTHGERLNSVHLVLESIAAGSVLPSRLILWVDTKDAYENPSAGLRRLVSRGLEICLSDNFGPHTKYFPYLLSTDTLNIPLVTADDDLLYSPWWLEGLVQSHHSEPRHLNCYRAHVVELQGKTLAPYRNWKPCLSDRAKFLHFPTGVSGCIYPVTLQERLKESGSEFLGICPKADDVWIHVNALRAGIKVRQIKNHPLRFPLVPGTQESGLYHSNVLEDGNDGQIQRTYSKEDISILQAT
jgi:hypothetical protein